MRLLSLNPPRRRGVASTRIRQFEWYINGACQTISSVWTQSTIVTRDSSWSIALAVWYLFDGWDCNALFSTRRNDRETHTGTTRSEVDRGEKPRRSRWATP